MLTHRCDYARLEAETQGVGIISATSYQYAVPEHGQQGGSSEATGEFLQVCVSQPLTVRNQCDPAGGCVTFPVHTADDARRETLQEPHQTRLRIHTHTHFSALVLSSRGTFTQSAVNRSVILLFFSGTCAFHYCVVSVKRASHGLNDRL